MSDSENPPYFDGLFARLAANDPGTVTAFGRHVHWGYWPDPEAAACTPESYAEAAEALCAQICELADIQDGMRVLDVGCGFGGTLARLNETHADLELVGVNIDPRQLERAAELVLPQRGNTVEFVQADAAQIPLDNDRFDVVLAVECIFHFDRPAFLSEAARLMTPRGNLTLSDFVPHQRTLEYLDSMDLSADEGVRWSYGQIDLTCSLDRYRALAGQSGLTLHEERDITPHTLPTYDYLYASTEGWPDADEVALFKRATRMLEKASRSGLIGYQLLRFGPEPGVCPA